MINYNNRGFLVSFHNYYRLQNLKDQYRDEVARWLVSSDTVGRRTNTPKIIDKLGFVLGIHSICKIVIKMITEVNESNPVFLTLNE